MASPFSDSIQIRARNWRTQLTQRSLRCTSLASTPVLLVSKLSQLAHIIHWISHHIYHPSMSMILSYAANGFGIFVVGGIALFTALAHSPLTPFFWHPITMSLAFVFYMVQGVLALVSKHSVLHSFFEFAERKFKIDAHYWCQVRPMLSGFRETLTGQTIPLHLPHYTLT